MDIEILGLVITVAWCMWFNRNVVRQGKARQQNVTILQRTMYLMEEFQMANFKLAQLVISDIVLWTPPILSWYKINIRVIIQDHTGQVEAALSKKLPITLGPLETKAKALKEGVYYAWAVRVHDAVFESDSKIIISALNGISEALVSIDIIVVGIRNKLQDFRCMSISHVKRNSNHLVHHLV